MTEAPYYLIERNDRGFPEWLAYNPRRTWWTSTSALASRWTDRDDAETAAVNYRKKLDLFHLCVTEHMDMQPVETIASAVARAGLCTNTDCNCVQHGGPAVEPRPIGPIRVMPVLTLIEQEALMRRMDAAQGEVLDDVHPAVVDRRVLLQALDRERLARKKAEQALASSCDVPNYNERDIRKLAAEEHYINLGEIRWLLAAITTLRAEKSRTLNDSDHIAQREAIIDILWPDGHVSADPPIVGRLRDLLAPCKQCASVLKQTGAAIGVEPGAAVRHLVADRDACADERDAMRRSADDLRADRDRLITVIARIAEATGTTMEALCENPSAGINHEDVRAVAEAVRERCAALCERTRVRDWTATECAEQIRTHRDTRLPALIAVTLGNRQAARARGERVQDIQDASAIDAPPVVLEVMIYPMRDGIHFGTTIRWSEKGAERMMRIMGGASREQLLGVIGAVFDKKTT